MVALWGRCAHRFRQEGSASVRRAPKRNSWTAGETQRALHTMFTLGPCYAKGQNGVSYVHTYVHTYIHTYIHTSTHIHTYIQTDRQTNRQTDIHTYHVHTLSEPRFYQLTIVYIGAISCQCFQLHATMFMSVCRHINRYANKYQQIHIWTSTNV